MLRMLFSLWPYRLVRIALGLVFVVAGITKLVDPKAFAKVLSMYDIIPEQFLPLVAIGLPLTEILAGLGLIFIIRGSLAVIGGLLILFITVLSYGVFNNLDINCGCSIPWESEKHASLKSALYRDSIMVGIVIYLYLWRRISPYKNSIKPKTIRRRKS
jgi:uncharacterized membrane protein YphA (DoxX/SURF4 family)